MDYIECEKIQSAGYCADNDCDCALTPLPHGGGYIYISKEVANFRKDALSLTEVQAKLEQMTESGEYISVSKYAPILICEYAAQRRNLDLAIAKADAALYWKEGRVPLRPTPFGNNSEDLFQQEPFQQYQPSDIYKESETINNEPTENEQTPQYDEPVSVPMESQIVPEVNKQKSVLRDVSVDDVVNQFSSGPLAELAKRMAQDLGNGDSDLSVNSSSCPVPETIITSGVTLKPMAQEFDDNTPPPHITKKKAQVKVKSKKIKLKSTKNSVMPVLFTVIGILLAISVIAAATAFLIAKLRQSKPVTVTVQPPKIEERPMEISHSFFEKTYLFEDAYYKGTISFKLSDELNGNYIQSVNLKGKEKTYMVHGVFTYTTNSITFRPDSYSKDIVWILDEYNQEGNAIFHDPSEQNIETARVYLHREN